VFGYGSLVGGHAHGRVARLHGYRRVWGVAMDNARDLPGYKSYRLRSDASRPDVFVAFLDIQPCAGGVVTGVCLEVDDTALRVLDARERNYHRIDVTAAIDEVRGCVWAYVGSDAGRARLREGRAQRRAVVSRDYLDGAIAGVAAIAAHEAADLERRTAEAGLPVLDLDRIDLPDSP
jgi:gamma-glutamylcyclotransferase (GGCT)/AIG2-like uncharacterized protein YtfP